MRQSDAILHGFRPVRAWLIEPLSKLAKDNSTSRRLQATVAIADYASDDPEQLTRMLAADKRQLAEIFPALVQQAEAVRSALHQRIPAAWQDDAHVSCQS